MARFLVLEVVGRYGLRSVTRRAAGILSYEDGGNGVTRYKKASAEAASVFIRQMTAIASLLRGHEVKRGIVLSIALIARGTVTEDEAGRHGHCTG